MDAHEPTELRPGETWLRLVVMLVYFFIVFYVVKFLIGTSMLFQFVLVVFRGSVNIRLKKFIADLNLFAYSVLQYVSWNTNQRPFPFCDWPCAEDLPAPAEDR